MTKREEKHTDTQPNYEVQQYLNLIGRYSLLTFEQERELGQKQESAWTNLYTLLYQKLRPYYFSSIQYLTERYNKEEISTLVNTSELKEGSHNIGIEEIRSIITEKLSTLQNLENIINDKKSIEELNEETRTQIVRHSQSMGLSLRFMTEIYEQFKKDAYAYEQYCNPENHSQRNQIAKRISPQFRETFALSKKLTLGKIEQVNLLLKELDVYLGTISRIRDEYVNHNLRLVVKVAKSYYSRDTLLDIIQQGNLGLMRAAEKFDYSRGNKFSTYAVHWIRQSITRYLYESSKPVRIPLHISEKRNRIAKIRNKYLQDYGKLPSLEELSKLSEISIKKIQQWDNLSVTTDSLVELDSSLKEDEDDTLINFIDDKNNIGPEESAINENLNERIRRAIATLQPREEYVIRKRFGLGEANTSTLEELGAELGLTRERVRQIEEKALRKLRFPARSLKLKEFVKD